MQDCDTIRFQEYVLSSFEDIIQNCSIEEMAEFTFGSVNEALHKF